MWWGGLFLFAGGIYDDAGGMVGFVEGFLGLGAGVGGGDVVLADEGVEAVFEDLAGIGDGGGNFLGCAFEGSDFFAAGSDAVGKFGEEFLGGGLGGGGEAVVAL